LCKSKTAIEQIMRAAKAIVLISSTALAACSPELPNSGDTISAQAQNAPFPKLLPLGALLGKVDAGSTVEADALALNARVAQLKARADALRGRSIYDGQESISRLP
jgi:hypothetical protein